MKKNIYFLFSLFFFLFSPIVSWSAVIQVRVPSQVSCGENFRLQYIVNNADVESFRAGNIPAGLEVIAGPYTSTQSSIQIVNGHTTSSSSVTYTYTLYAAKNGTYTIPSARAVINGKSVASPAARITISGSAAKAQSGRQQAPRMHGDEEDDMRRAGSRITGNDLFIKVIANKHKVYEQEPVLLTYKVYTQLDLSQLEGKMPDLTGFHTQEIQLPQQKSLKVERLNGKTYKTVVTNQYVMYPQMTGKLTVPSITFKGIVVQRNDNVDPFEAFFNGGSGYVEVHRDVAAPKVDIEVLPLPKRPAGFSGGVGKFSVSAKANRQSLKAGEPLTISVIVSGQGNLKLLKQPQLDLPKDFDKYDPKTTDQTKITANGLEGSMKYDFLIVPRNKGNYTIPGIKFIYFDTTTNSYRTLETQPIKVQVGKSEGKSSVADFAKDNDIHDLHKGNTHLQEVGDYMVGSSSFWTCIVLPLVVFVVLVYIFRKRAQRNANIVLMKGLKANKVATKRLKKAARLMKQQKQMEFYDEVLRALWGYVSDKLNIPVSELSRDNITEKLQNRQISEQTIQKFIAALDECEYARYAPGDPKGKMDIVYDKAATAINEINDSIK